MEARLEYRKFSQEPYQAMLALEKYLANCGLDHKFVHLLKLRASQINGCAFCIDMHSKDAREAGETEQQAGAECPACASDCVRFWWLERSPWP